MTGRRAYRRGRRHPRQDHHLRDARHDPRRRPAATPAGSSVPASPASGAAPPGAATGPLVVEADESDGTFLALRAEVALVTNVEPDHLEHWGGEAALRVGVRAVRSPAPPARRCCAPTIPAPLRSPRPSPTRSPTAPIPGAPTGSTTSSPTAPACASASPTAGERLEVAVPAAPGLHNARNAAGALAVAHRLGVPLVDGVVALGGFRGVARRFEVRGEAGGVLFVDSYDHLPTEVAAALAAARGGPWRRVVCCFQPHRYSRTEALGATFGRRLRRCRPPRDHRRVRGGGASPARGHRQARGRRRARRPPLATGRLAADPRRRGRRTSAAVLRPGDLCLTLGAGDLTSVPDRLLGPGARGRRRVSRGRGRRGPPPARSARRGRRAARTAHDLPGRRVRRLSWCGSPTSAACAWSPTRWRPPGSTCSWSARGRTSSSPTAGFRGLALVLDDAFADDRRRRYHGAGRAPPQRSRSWPAARWPPGSRASSGPSACPGRSAAGCG